MNKLYQQLQSGNESERMYAIEDLTENMNDEVFLLFLERLKIENSQLVKDKLVMQMESALATHQVGGGSILARVFALFLAHNAYLRNCAIQILSAGNDVAVKFLSANYAVSNVDVRKLILDTLVLIGTENAKTTIRKALDDKDINIRITAIEYLGNLNDTECIPKLLEMLHTTDKDMLIISVCECIVKVGKTSDLISVLNLILPTGNLETVSGLYFPSVLSLVSKVWSKPELLKILETKKIKSYYEDYQIELLDFLTNACNRFPDFIDERIVLKTITELLKLENIYEKTPYIALSLLDTSQNQKMKNQLANIYSDDEIEIKTLSKNIVQIINQKA